MSKQLFGGCVSDEIAYSVFCTRELHELLVHYDCDLCVHVTASSVVEEEKD